MITIGAGIIIFRKTDKGVEFFVASPGGPIWGNRECWNFPKGHMEEGEIPFECAVREFTEETGVSISDDVSKYNYLGLIKQRNDKKVHVFAKEWEGEELGDNCYSNTFIWKDGNEYPEIGKYAWMTVSEIEEKGGVKSYYPIFKQIEKEL